jgi:predicted anti-sigma-YlaC factor YlaD
MSAHLQDEQLTAALDGTLSVPDRAAVDAHLETCARCRGELELARDARGALRSLSDEIRPPIDVAAAVMSEISGGSRQHRARSGPGASQMPRWYRAAGLVAAAAAIALAVLIVPRVVGNDTQHRAETAAVEAGGSGTQGGRLAPAAGKSALIEDAAADFDAASLQGLLDDAVRPGTFGSAASATAATDASAPQPSERDLKALHCVRAAGGDAIPDGAQIVRLIDATYLGTPATLGVYSLPDGRGGVWVAARDDCRLLASATTPG